MNIDDLFKFKINATKEEVINGRIGNTYYVMLKPKVIEQKPFGSCWCKYVIEATKTAENDYILSNAEQLLFGPFGYICTINIDLENTLKQYEEGTLPF